MQPPRSQCLNQQGGDRNGVGCRQYQVGNGSYRIFCAESGPSPSLPNSALPSLTALSLLSRIEQAEGSGGFAGADGGFDLAGAFGAQRGGGEGMLPFARDFVGGEGGGALRRAGAAQAEDDIVHHVGQLLIILDPAVGDIGQADEIGAGLWRAEEPADPAAQFGELRGRGAAVHAMAASALFDIVGAGHVWVGDRGGQQAHRRQRGAQAHGRAEQEQGGADEWAEQAGNRGRHSSYLLTPSVRPEPVLSDAAGGCTSF